MPKDLASSLTTALNEVERLRAENTTLQTMNASLRAQNLECSEAVAQLTGQLANKQSRYRKRPPIMNGRTVQKNVGCGPLYVTLNEDGDGRPFEVFFKLGKSGSCQQSYLEALGVVMSVGLRYGADPQKFVDKLAGMRCPNPLTKLQNQGKPGTLSCADAISQGIAQALALALPGTEPDNRREATLLTVAEPRVTGSLNGSASLIDLIENLPAKDTQPLTLAQAMQTGVGMCPKCSGPLIFQGGCSTCLQECGYEKCG